MVLCRLFSASLCRRLRFFGSAATPTTTLSLDASSGAKCAFPGGPEATYTSQLAFTFTGTPIPVYRVLNFDGTVVDESLDPKWSKEQCLKLYKEMVLLNVLDDVMYKAQRQGVISFYMTSYGEESTQIGSAAALHPDDMVFGQYREQGVLMHRGFPLRLTMAQLYSTKDDLGKGRQMPVHFGSREHNFQTISSPLGTQLPQASGAAYAYKLEGKPNVVVCYFGEGAASEGDFHPALNFAATLDCPVVFFCRNNAFAISTPSSEQYRGDAIAGRGPPMGVPSIRVDGTDLFAVYAVTKAARELALSKNVPVLIEAMSYRAGHHSTSDDSSRYRDASEITQWLTTPRNPIHRFRLYLERKGYWTEAEEKALRGECMDRVVAAMDEAEHSPKPPFSEMCTDVYAPGTTEPVSLVRQRKALQDHIALYPDKYPSLDGRGGHDH